VQTLEIFKFEPAIESWICWENFRLNCKAEYFLLSEALLKLEKQKATIPQSIVAFCLDKHKII